MLASYRVNNELRIGLELSYIFMSYKFDPAYTGINQYIVYDPAKDANAITTYFEWGFGVYWAFAEGKNKVFIYYNEGVSCNWFNVGHLARWLRYCLLHF